MATNYGDLTSAVFLGRCRQGFFNGPMSLDDALMKYSWVKSKTSFPFSHRKRLAVKGEMPNCAPVSGLLNRGGPSAIRWRHNTNFTKKSAFRPMVICVC